MTRIRTLFATRLFEASIPDAAALNAEIAAAIAVFSKEDAAGRAWCAAHAYPGYTSHGSLEDLPRRAPCFKELKRRLDRLAARFARDLAFDLAGRRLKLDNMWVNALGPGGVHSGHIHPHAVLSGTYYVSLPKGASAIRFEDPRLAMMMAAPPRAADAPEDLQPFVYVAPAPGMVLMWESWLRHEVVRHTGRAPRLSVSFNYRWA